MSEKIDSDQIQAYPTLLHIIMMCDDDDYVQYSESN